MQFIENLFLIEDDPFEGIVVIESAIDTEICTRISDCLLYTSFGLKAIAHNISKMAARRAVRHLGEAKSLKKTHYWRRTIQINDERKKKAA